VAEELILVHGADFPGMAQDIRSKEIRRKLKELSTNDGKNYATVKKSVPTPATGIVILPAPAVGPDGSKKICDGELTVGGQAIKVTAFRLP